MNAPQPRIAEGTSFAPPIEKGCKVVDGAVEDHNGYYRFLIRYDGPPDGFITEHIKTARLAGTQGEMFCGRNDVYGLLIPCRNLTQFEVFDVRRKLVEAGIPIVLEQWVVEDNGQA
ncbi:MAG: hypothetical protein QF755_03290 [Candidatus Peribacteraceae bacterium]|jgi:hypothetical protein|nr:hypothetical protein [Candidatus Peribacteraceae bacterium]|tara:strand:+ start:5847 stop:6194 length:348 start_codon:yes stop_codon:yes gene_type:complete